MLSSIANDLSAYVRADKNQKILVAYGTLMEIIELLKIMRKMLKIKLFLYFVQIAAYLTLSVLLPTEVKEITF